MCGLLNFISRAVVPGRAFTRRLYAYTSSKNKSKPLLPHHHITITGEMKKDLSTWVTFLHHPSTFSRPFIDFEKTWCANEGDFYMDASGKIGLGGICMEHWMGALWDENFITNCLPSIEFLELYALVAGILAWIHLFANQRVILFCDNISVRDMVNSTSSSCHNCMTLIHALVLKCMTVNVRVFIKYVKSVDNEFADALSRGQIEYFKSIRINHDRYPTSVPEQIWPISKIWIK